MERWNKMLLKYYYYLEVVYIDSMAQLHDMSATGPMTVKMIPKTTFYTYTILFRYNIITVLFVNARESEPERRVVCRPTRSQRFGGRTATASVHEKRTESTVI